ncbi:putative PHD transcription factor [Aspergillus steynii IBT 23096]|uniref:Putative PHD transcription factor n=1 Tax=Aspergillus steynii IBT 23096 TaxID=1392250 RepID=A0A2I2GIV0_9EURO|nr:putative PHD transcription factor [Aspergillus steynii IBT 23096]PLB52799.1 putative PHD transcription factor [Aspergillus steynii IBT 23096]
MAGDTNGPADPSQGNNGADDSTTVNPYETIPENLPKDDPFLKQSPHYGRYHRRDDDFTPQHDHWYQSDAGSFSYWQDFVRSSWTSENSLNLPGTREAFAVGNVIIRVDSEPALDTTAEKYSYANANELSAARKAEEALRELNVAVPVIYFYGTIDGKNVSVESRIPGVSLEVAWRYLSDEQINTFKQQCRRILERLRDTDSPPESPSYVCSELNSQLPPEVRETERDILFKEKGEGESLDLVHNNLTPPNVIVSDDQVVGILGWRHCGFFGFGRANKIHRQFRVSENLSGGVGGLYGNVQTWLSLYENMSGAGEGFGAGENRNTPGPPVKTEPSTVALDRVPLDEDVEEQPVLSQLDGADLLGEHPTPKKIANLKHGGTSRASSISDRSSPANSTKQSTGKKPATSATKKGVGRKPTTKKRKLNDVDNESVDGGRSNTPSSARGSKTPAAKKRGSTSVAGSPAPEPKPKKKGRKKAAVQQEDDDDDDSIDENELFCICRKPDNHTWMIACDGECDDWFHGKCVNIDPRDADLIEKYICPNCKEKGLGWTTWKPMCRLPECRKPARVYTNNPSKYCTDEHGREFMLAKTRPLGVVLSTGPRKSLTNGRNAVNGLSRLRDVQDAESQTNGSPVENGIATIKGQRNGIPEELGSRGGILTAGELKALVTDVSSASEFRKLGERIITPPPEEEGEAGEENPEGEAKPKKKLGLDVDPDPNRLTYSPDEASKIEEMRKWRDELHHRKDMLNARNTFLTFVRQRSKAIVEKLKQTDPKGGWKDICGFDTRLAWSDEEFDEWRLSDAGAKALQDGTPELLASSHPDATDADGDATMDTDDNEMAHTTRGVCTKKRCERHKQWLKIQQQEILFEENTLTQDLKRCETEAQNVVERAVLRMWAETDNAQVGCQ